MKYSRLLQLLIIPIKLIFRIVFRDNVILTKRITHTPFSLLQFVHNIYNTYILTPVVSTNRTIRGRGEEKYRRKLQYTRGGDGRVDIIICFPPRSWERLRRRNVLEEPSAARIIVTILWYYIILCIWTTLQHRHRVVCVCVCCENDDK